jgi:hypothetical protein
MREEKRAWLGGEGLAWNFSRIAFHASRITHHVSPFHLT